MYALRRGRVSGVGSNPVSRAEAQRDQASITAILADPLVLVRDLMAADNVDAGELRFALDKIASLSASRDLAGRIKRPSVSFRGPARDAVTGFQDCDCSH